MKYNELLVINEKSILLYAYYALEADSRPSLQEIHSKTTLSQATIRRHDKVLSAIGAIEITVHKGRGVKRDVVVNPVKKPTIPLPLLLYNILNIPSQKSNAFLILKGDTSDSNIYKDIYTKEEQRGARGFSSTADIKSDSDWKAMEILFKARFEPFEYAPERIVGKHRFDRLIELYTDTTLDFEGYLDWYTKNKYPGKGFNFGLFLLPSMIKEYRLESAKVAPYLKTTTNIQASEEFHSQVDSFKDFTRTLEGDL